jgi:hypothetical protein
LPLATFLCPSQRQVRNSTSFSWRVIDHRAQAWLMVGGCTTVIDVAVLSVCLMAGTPQRRPTRRRARSVRCMADYSDGEELFRLSGAITRSTSDASTTICGTAAHQYEITTQIPFKIARHGPHVCWLLKHMNQ